MAPVVRGGRVRDAVIGIETAVVTTDVIATDAASSVGSNTATLNGTVNDLLGNASVDVWFVYKEKGEDVVETETAAQTVSSTGSYSESISGLDSATTYWYYAVMDEDQDGDADYAGDTVEFTTS